MKPNPEHDALLQEITQLEEALRAKKMELYNARCAALPFKVGDIVLDADSDREYMIKRIYNAELGWVVGVPRKKDGSWSVRERTIFKPVALPKEKDDEQHV